MEYSWHRNLARLVRFTAGPLQSGSLVESKALQEEWPGLAKGAAFATPAAAFRFSSSGLRPRSELHFHGPVDREHRGTLTTPTHVDLACTGC
jgi:hypothetical protein